MQGDNYTYDLEPAWAVFLQVLSDAVVFQGTPPNFPAYPWASNPCTLTL
jgi:hypothetical protein